MIRSGVFIGVDRTGGLQQLHDAANGAVKMHAWALSQGMDPQNAVLITDGDGRDVSPDDIFDAVSAIVNGPGTDQLLIYFAGHGVNLNRGEQWLLSDAPVRSSAAVDVRNSVELARYCGIGHVVVISDACRVAPEGIQAQNVRGVDIFPNDGAGSKAKPVDQFYACLLGRTAAELRDPQAAATSFSALYTTTLLRGLSGQVPELLEPLAEGGSPGCVRPRRLEAWLESEVPAQVRARQLQNTVNQNPDAIITSDREWLAEVRGQLAPLPGPNVPTPAPPGGPGPAPGRMLSRMTTAVLSGQPELLAPFDDDPDLEDLPGGAALRTARDVAAPFGPDHFETECGLKVRGAGFRDVLVVGARLEGFDAGWARIAPTGPEAVSVVVRFTDGTGTVVPALPGFLVGLTVEDGDLVDVAYEPSVNSGRWGEYRDRAEELRFLRGVASAASAHGRFRLVGDQAQSLAQRMQLGKALDPTLAVYAAYAYQDLQDLDRIEEMSGYLRGDLGVGLFDVELLARRLVDTTVGPHTAVVPCVPLLAQGWGVLRANRVHLPTGLDELGEHLLDSVWSLYDPRGVEMLQRALVRGDMR